MARNTPSDLSELARSMRLEQLNRRQMVVAMLAAAGCGDFLDIEVEPIGGLEVTEEGQLLLDPITDNDSFYVYTCCGGHEPDPDNWALSISTAPNQISLLDASWFDGQDPIQLEYTLECIGNGARGSRIGNAVWGGLPLIDVLDQIGAQAPESAVEIRLQGQDGYDASIPATDLEDERVWLVWEMNGEPLPLDHGGPARLIVLGRYGIKNLKWITKIDWVDRPHEGHWDRKGNWSHEGEYLPNAFILAPFWEEEVTGPVTILGVAYAGNDPVIRVEVTFDRGETFHEATIDYAPGRNVWAIWRYEFEPPGPGDYEVTARVTTQQGRQSQISGKATDPKQGFDSCLILPFRVL